MTYEAAHQVWTDMTAMERYAIMEKVGYMKSMTKRLRACVAFIQKGGL